MMRFEIKKKTLAKWRRDPVLRHPGNSSVLKGVRMKWCFNLYDPCRNLQCHWGMLEGCWDGRIFCPKGL